METWVIVKLKKKQSMTLRYLFVKSSIVSAKLVTILKFAIKIHNNNHSK